MMKFQSSTEQPSERDSSIWKNHQIWKEFEGKINEELNQIRVSNIPNITKRKISTNKSHLYLYPQHEL